MMELVRVILASLFACAVIVLLAFGTGALVGVLWLGFCTVARC